MYTASLGGFSYLVCIFLFRFLITTLASFPYFPKIVPLIPPLLLVAGSQVQDPTCPHPAFMCVSLLHRVGRTTSPFLPSGSGRKHRQCFRRHCALIWLIPPSFLYFSRISFGRFVPSSSVNGFYVGTLIPPLTLFLLVLA